MSNKQYEVNRIRELIISWYNNVKVSSKMHLDDEANFAEDAIAFLLNKVNGWDLHNLNAAGINYPGIDLLDESNKVAVQVTLQNVNASKKDETFVDQTFELIEQDYQVIIFAVTTSSKPNAKLKREYQDHSFTYNAADNYQDIPGILNQIKSLSVNDLRQLYTKLEPEFGLNQYGKNDGSLQIVDDDFIKNQLARSIADLGIRYTPDFNVETDNKWPIEILANTEAFLGKAKELQQSVIEPALSLLRNIKGNKILANAIKIDEVEKEINDIIDEKLSYDSDYFGIMTMINTVISKLPNPSFVDEMNDDEKSYWRHYLYEFESKANEYAEFLDKAYPVLISKPYLLITGTAGIGKSHLLGDYSKKLVELGHDCILFLGQHFYDTANAGNQLMSRLSLQPNQVKQVLGELEKRAVSKDKKAIILIDALNEGTGKTLWPNELQSLMQEIQKSEHIGIILSVRSEYEASVIPEEFIENNDFQKMTHVGLTGDINESIKAFCRYYQVPYPTMPTFNELYTNPLILKLICQVAQREKKSFSESFSIESIFNEYLLEINQRIALPDRIDFDSNINLVKKCLFSIAELKISAGVCGIGYVDALTKVSAVGKQFDVGNPGKILLELVHEGVLQFVDFGDEQKYVDFQFERYGDYFVALYIFERYLASDEGRANLENIGELKQYFGGHFEISNNYGMIQMLSVLVANSKNAELFGYLPQNGNLQVVAEVIIEGLPFRAPKGISTKFVAFVENQLINEPKLMLYFYNSQFQLAGIKKSAFNAKWLNDWLTKMSQQKIDQMWTANISHKFQTYVRDYCEWYRNTEIELDLVTADLVLKQLGWILSSCYRFNRDHATLAITNILRMKPELMMSFFNNFYHVNDRYVVERALAALFGAVVSCKNSEILSGIANLVYNEVFNQQTVYPNVLVRDYARGIIDYCVHFNYVDVNQLDIKKTVPPYQSDWQYPQVSEKKIAGINKKYANCSGWYSVNNSLAYDWGDFSKYVFEPKFRDWNNRFEIQELLRIAKKRVLELGYSPELFSEFDKLEGRYFDRFDNAEERIGKKYEWIVMSEMLAKIGDNFQPYDDEISYDSEYQQYQESMYERLFHDFDIDFVDTEENNDESDVVVEELIAEEHIDNRKRIYKEVEPTWENYMRDIDPTCTIEKLPTSTESYFTHELPKVATQQWLKQTIDEKTLSNYFKCTVGNEHYYALAFYHDDIRLNEKSLKKRNRSDEYTVIGRAVLVENGVQGDAIEELSNQHGTGVWPPNLTSTFLKEYYWSAATDYWLNLEDEHNKWIEVAYSHSWEKSNQYTTFRNDNDSSNTMDMFIPFEKIVDFGSLILSDELVWKTPEGKEIAFDARVKGADRALLIEHEFMDEFLEQNNYALMWMCYYEKRWQNQYHDSHYISVQDGSEYNFFTQDEGEGTFKDW